MIAIVGAGVTGLALSHNLVRRGVGHVVLEADDEPGGVVRSRVVEGRVLELGPQRTRLTPGVRGLVEELGLGDELVLAEPGLPLFVYRDGRLRQVPFTPAQAARTDLLSCRAVLRGLLEPFTAGARDDETVAEFFTRKFGRETYEALLGPIYGGLYASDPADMLVRLSLRQTLEDVGLSGSLVRAFFRRGFGAREAAAACSFRDGMQTLPLALHAAVRDRVRLSTPVRALTSAGAGFRVETDDGAIDAGRVVLTVPAEAASRLLRAAAPDAAERLGRLRYNPMAIVHLHADCELRGMGYQVAFGEGLLTRGVTWNDSLFGRAGVYTAFLGGAKRPDAIGLPDAELERVACDEFRRVTGCAARPVRVTRVGMPAWDRSWTALEGLDLPAGIRLCANYESRAGIAGRLQRARVLAAELAGAGLDHRLHPGVE